jgi:hypothetical protein
MNNLRLQNHPFWGPRSPLSTFIGTGLLIMASSRVAFALVTLGALVWVYGLTALVFRLSSPVLPKTGKYMILVFLSAFWGAVYYLALFFISPFLAMETSLFILLAPGYCIASRVPSRVDSLLPRDALTRAVSEALILGSLVLAMALIREPLGFGSFSLPGGLRGIIEIFGKEKNASFSIQVISGSAGAFLLLGYCLALFRREKSRRFRRGSNETSREEL